MHRGILSRAVLLLALVAAAATVRADDAPAAPAPAADPTWLSKLPFEMHGGAYIWHYEPLVDGADNNTELYFAYVSFQKAFGPKKNFSYYFEPRFRDTKLRSFFPGNVWVQQAYVGWTSKAGTLKIGKISSQFGKAWDGCFYGNIPYFDGLKLDPDVGASLEGNRKFNDAWSLAWSAQFFTVDGRTNGSLPGRDTLSITGARERNSYVARLAPTWKGGKSSVTFGMSGQRFTADLPTAYEDETVSRVNAEMDVEVPHFGIFGDYTWQTGFQVPDFPVPGPPTDRARYLMSGIEAHTKHWSYRYNYSFGDYGETGVRETMHQPGIVATVNDNFAVMFEYAWWRRDAPSGKTTQDNSLNLILDVHF
jgi:hypothetical protein